MFCGYNSQVATKGGSLGWEAKGILLIMQNPFLVRWVKEHIYDLIQIYASYLIDISIDHIFIKEDWVRVGDVCLINFKYVFCCLLLWVGYLWRV